MSRIESLNVVHTIIRDKNDSTGAVAQLGRRHFLEGEGCLDSNSSGSTNLIRKGARIGQETGLLNLRGRDVTSGIVPQSFRQ